jgi:cytochrome c biogenesis protein
VNHPLRIEGDRVYLIGHGFAPKVTVTMPDGKTVSDVAAFVPTNATTLLSEGAFKEQGKPGANQDVGISAFFAPTPMDTGNGIITSLSPIVTDPVLGVRVFTGDLNYTGIPQSVYSLDTTKLNKVGMANLTTGQSKTFTGPNGPVTVRFDGWVPWASLQVSHDPAQGWLLLAAVAMVVGLLGSLAVRRRRIWVRVQTAEGESHTVVQVGGLARSDSGNFTAEFGGIFERLRESVDGVRTEV